MMRRKSCSVPSHPVPRRPGHTNDSMIVHVPGYMMTGDFLFNGAGGVVETIYPVVEFMSTGTPFRFFAI